MAIYFNQREIAPIPGANGVARQPLLNAARVPGILFQLDRLTVAPGGQAALSIAPNKLAWFEMIDGAATLHAAGRDVPVGGNHIGLLPAGFAGSWSVTPGNLVIRSSA